MENKKLPKALYRGELPIGDIKLDCFVLDDDKQNPTRIISQATIFTAFKRPRRGNRAQDTFTIENGDVITLPPFVASKTLFPLINQELMKLITPIKFIDGNQEKFGYNAEILPAICSLYLRARRGEGGVQIKSSQKPLAMQAEILQEGFAKVGIIALVDEATGFQYDRKHEALRIILDKYIADKIQEWKKRFPDVFFTELDRLYNNEKTTSRKRPQYYGLFIIKYIYDPIEKGYVKKELDKKNIDDNGKRKARFHQWLTTDFGVNQLIMQIGRVMGVMELSPNIKHFKEKVARQKELAVWPDLFPETLDK